MGNLEGVRLLGLLRKNDIEYLGSFFLYPEDIKLILGGLWNFSKEQDCTELISDYGAQRGRL
jgi:hypothetical protein